MRQHRAPPHRRLQPAVCARTLRVHPEHRRAILSRAVRSHAPRAIRAAVRAARRAPPSLRVSKQLLHRQEKVRVHGPALRAVAHPGQRSARRVGSSVGEAIGVCRVGQLCLILVHLAGQDLRAGTQQTSEGMAVNTEHFAFSFCNDTCRTWYVLDQSHLPVVVARRIMHHKLATSTLGTCLDCNGLSLKLDIERVGLRVSLLNNHLSVLEACLDEHVGDLAALLGCQALEDGHPLKKRIVLRPSILSR